eukprot:864-Heterococcus_DN1.PRE.3
MMCSLDATVLAKERSMMMHLGSECHLEPVFKQVVSNMQGLIHAAVHRSSVAFSKASLLKTVPQLQQ